MCAIMEDWGMLRPNVRTRDKRQEEQQKSYKLFPVPGTSVSPVRVLYEYSTRTVLV